MRLSFCPAPSALREEVAGSQKSPGRRGLRTACTCPSFQPAVRTHPLSSQSWWNQGSERSNNLPKETQAGLSRMDVRAKSLSSLFSWPGCSISYLKVFGATCFFPNYVIWVHLWGRGYQGSLRGCEPHLSVAETSGVVRRHLPSPEAGSPGRARLQEGARASSERSRSAAAPWTAETALPWALEAGGWERSAQPCSRVPLPTLACCYPPRSTLHMRLCLVLGEHSSSPRDLPHRGATVAKELGAGWASLRSGPNHAPFPEKSLQSLGC